MNFQYIYSKCSKISYTKVSDKMAYANSADLDQTVHEGAAWSGSTVFANSTKHFKKQMHKKQNFRQNKCGRKCLKFCDIYLKGSTVTDFWL